MPILERLLTDYIRGIMMYNDLGGTLTRPISVDFGLERPVICASDDAFCKFSNEDRLS